MCKCLEIKYANIFFSSIANLKCTPSGRQMYSWAHMYPRLGTPVLGHVFLFLVLVEMW